MKWLEVWWRQMVGPPASDPWSDDPRIQQERAGQHDRITKATPSILGQSIEEREARRRLLEIQSNPRGIGHE